MTTPVNVPKLGTTMTEATLVEWLAGDGDPVAAGQPICSIETDKIEEDIAAPADGTLRQIAAAGGLYQVGEPLAEIA